MRRVVFPILVFVLAVAGFVLALSGCGGTPLSPGPDLAPAPEPVAIEVGAPADGGIAPLVDGQDVTLVEGAQGGFHVWLAYRVRGVAAGSTIELDREAFRVPDGTVVLRFDGEADVGAPDADGWYTAPAPIPMFMCPTPIGVSIVGVPIRYELQVVDQARRQLGLATVTLVPRCPADQQDFCTRICTG